MKVVKNYLYNAFYQVFILLVPLVTTPYLARVLGPTGVGINSYTNSIVQYFILFGSIGINLYGNRQIAYVRDDRGKLTKTFYEIFIMRIVTIILSCLAFGVFILNVNKYQAYYLAQSVSIIAAAFDISWFFMGIENFSVTVFRNLVIKIIALVSIFIFVKSYSDLTIYILILSLSVLLGNLTLFTSLRLYIDSPNLKKLNIWKHLLPSLSLFIPQIATQIYLALNKTMLGSMVSVQSAGYFDQSDKMIKMVLAVVTATGTVMLPHVANAFANGESGKTKQYLYKSFNFVTSLSVPMMFGMMAVTNKFVPLFFTNRFVKVVPIMTIESAVILLIAWSNVIGTQFLLPTKRLGEYTFSVIMGAIVNLIVNIPLIMSFGAIGAAISTVISELVVTLYQLFCVRKLVEFSQLFSDFYKYMLSGICMFLVVYILDRVLKDSWYILILEIIIGMVVYIFLIFVLKVRIINDLREILHDK